MSKAQPVKVQYQTLLIVWLALLMSQVLFLGLVFFLKPSLFKFDTSQSFFGDEPLIPLAFAGSALVFLIMSFVLSRQHLRRAIQDQDAACVQTGLVLGCALSEVPSLLGVVLAFAFEHPYFYLWIFLGMFGILAHFPRKGNLEAAMFRSAG